MPDQQAASRGEPIAIVGLACRFPDASDPAELLDLVLSQRRAFRRLPPGRVGLPVPGPADGGPGTAVAPGMTGVPDAGLAGPAGAAAGGDGFRDGQGRFRDGQDGGDGAGSAPGPAARAGTGRPAPDPGLRAALIEGWRFDRAAFGVTRPAYQATDPAHWLALETAARALADGGFPGGQGLSRDRTGVIIGNTLTGEVSRAAGLRSRWPHVRRVITSALADERIQQAEGAALLERAEARFLASFPEPNDQTLAGSLPSVIADRICGYFGFRGGGHAVDSAHSSSLLAVAAACSALATGDLDAAVAGGVDISLDPFELAGLAGMGVLADQEMRVYDARPTGFWPGEGCGLVVLMRAADARAAGLPAYAQIAGWGTSSAGNPALTRPGSGSLLLALRRAYQRAGVDPADVQLIEGDGTGTASGDLAELTSLAEIRQGAQALAAIGSVKANIGHTKAAAGAAGLIKAALSTAAGVIPPVTGCTRPHPLIASEEARLRVPRAPEMWPAGTRLAAVSAVGPGGTSVHLVLRRDNGSGPRRRVRLPGGYQTASSPRQQGRRAGSPADGTAPPGPPPPGTPGPPLPGTPPGTPLPGELRPAAGRPAGWAPAAARSVIAAPASAPAAEAFVFSGRDRACVAAELTRVAALAPWLSDAEIHDLACQLGNRSGGAGPVRVALVAGSPDELGQRAGQAVTLLRGLRPGRLAVAAGSYAAEGGRGRVTLLFPGDDATMAHPGTGAVGDAPRCDPAIHPAILAASLASLGLLDRLGVTAATGVGHGLGEITALVWAGCLSEPEAVRLVAQRSALLGDAPGDRAAMVCVQADAPTALALCAGTGLAIAAYNGPECQLLAGPVPAARELVRRAATRGVPAQLLSAPLALHTAALADLTAPLRIMLREFGFSPPARRQISTVSGRDLTVSDDVPALLCSQLTAPVRFTTALSLAAADADLLVETGPGQALSLLAGDFCDVPAVSLAWGRADPQATAQAMAALFAAGATRSLAPLYAGRAARPVDIWRERAFITNPCEKVPPAAAPGHRDGPGCPAAADRDGTGEAAGGCRSSADRIPAGQRAVPEPGGQPPRTGGTPGRPPARPAPEPPGRHARDAGPGGPASGTAAAEPAPADGPVTEPAASSAPAPGQPPASDADRGTGEAVPGVAPWLRCYVEELRRLAGRPPAEAAGPWRVRAARQPFGRAAGQIFEHDPDAGVVLAVLGDLADPEAWLTVLGAAREAAGTGRLVVITPSAGLSGFCAGLHREQPSLGITLIRTADSEDGLRGARRFATAEPGRLQALVLDGAGTPREPVMVAAEPAGGGTYPLGPADVVLVSGMTSPDDLACAGALAYRGAALAVLCAPGSEDDPQLSRCLASLRSAGRRVWYESADLADADAVAAAVEELESGLGPVTAVVHAIAAGPPAPCAQLPDAAVGDQLPGQVAGLANVLGAVQAARLRLLVTFGSASGRYGLQGGCLTALTSEAVAGYAARRAAALPGCRALHVAWPPWPGSLPPGSPAAGCAAGHPPGVPERSRLLQQLLASPDLPGYVAVHGRGGMHPAHPAEPGPAGLRGRFLETVRVHHPGVEIVADARLSMRTDPYLADYQIDGLPVLPAVLALEAMTQAGSALAGRPLRNASQVSLTAPLVVSGRQDGDQTVIRVCALRHGDEVETVLRCAETGFRVDHARAVFRAAGTDARAAAAGGTADRAAAADGMPPSGQAGAAGGAAGPEAASPQTPGLEAAGPGTASPETAGLPLAATAGAASGPRHAGPGDDAAERGKESSAQDSARDKNSPEREQLLAQRGTRAAAARRGDSAPGGIVDGTDLYGPVCFHSGRFRRVAFLPEITSGSCRALVRGGDDQPWFGALAGPVDAPMILGSPGLNDAALQVVQACLPHRRVLAAGCESVVFSGREVRGALQVHAVRRPAAGPGAHRRQEPGAPMPVAPAPGSPDAATPGAAIADAGIADAGAADAAPRHNARPGAQPAPPPGAASGIWDVIAVDATGEPVVAWAGVRLRDVGPLGRTAAWHPALLAVSLESRAIEFGLDPSLRVIISSGHLLVSHPAASSGPGEGPPGQPESAPVPGQEQLAWTDTAPGRGPLDGFELRVRAAAPVAARWAAVGFPQDGDGPPGPGLAQLRQQLLARPHETPASVDARLRAVSESLAALDGQGGQGSQAGQAMAIADDYDNGWIVLRSGRMLLASAVVEINGVPGTAAVSIAGTLPPAGPDGGPAPGQPSRAQPIPAKGRP
jgi:enediyne polyketide synthase